MRLQSFPIPLKKIFFLITIAFILNLNMSAQSILWKNRYNGAGDNSDRYNSVVADGLGNFYLTGYTVSPGTGKDFLTTKLNASGDTVWTKKYNYVSNFDDEANFIVIDNLGNITVTGYSDGGSVATKNDILTIQYNAAGTLLWSARYNYAIENEDEFPAAMAIDAANNIFITGRSDHDAANIDDLITIKYNAAGVEQWVNRYDGGLTDRAAGVVADNAGGCVVTGRTDVGASENIITISYSNLGATNWTSTYGAAGDDRGQAIASDAAGNIFVGGIRANASDDDFVTIKYNNTGVQQWANIVNGGDNDRLTTLKLDATGNVFVTGQTDIDAGGSTDYNFRTIKYNTAGVQQWSIITGNPVNQEDVPSDLYIDALGNVYVTGKSDASAAAAVNYEFMTAKYNASGVLQWLKYYDGTVTNAEDIPSMIVTDAASNVWISGSVNYTATQKDAVFVKYNSTGVFQVAKTYNGKGDFNDKVKAIAVDASNNMYVTGYTVAAAQQRNLLIQKVNSSGTTIWTNTFDGTGENDEGLAVTTDAAGNVYVAGYSNGAGSYDDGLLRKYNSAGVLQFSAIYNYAANQLDKFVSVAVAPSGDIYVTGYSDGNADVTINNYDIVTIKYNALGLQQWAVRYNGAGNAEDRPAKMIFNGNRLYITGHTSNGINNDVVTLKYDVTGVLLNEMVFAGAGAGLDEGDDLFILNNAVYVAGTEFVAGNMNDYLLIKYDTLLNQLWKKNYNGTADTDDRAFGVSATSTDVYVTGSSAGAGTGNDVALVRYNASTGTQNWAKRYKSAGAFNDEAYSVVTDAAGNIYTGGVTGSASSISDFITLNYNTAGAKLLTLKYNGTGSSEDIGSQVILDNSGYLYTTGSSTGTGTANFDFSTVKYCTPLPEAIITSAGPTTFCIGDSVALNANTGVGLTYQWKKGAADVVGATGATYYAKTSGAYKVVVYNANGCNKTSNTINVTGITCKENATEVLQLNMDIVPNPFTSNTEIIIGNLEEDAIIVIYDITGKMVLNESIQAGTSSFVVGETLAPGTYTVLISTATKVLNSQLVKVN
jgi:uncharacterized delta-60 repeat protein